MTRTVRAFVGALLTIVAIVPALLHADTVQLSIRDGRLSLVAVNATPAQIFEAWSRAGGVLVVNADRIPGTPLTITLENVPEEQALDTLLRPVTGYLARRRTAPVGSASVFDRIVIVPTPAAESRPAVTPAPTPAGSAARPMSPPPFAPAAAPTYPQPAPQPSGPTRLIGPDGQPVEDDQAGAPPPPSSAAGDAPDTRSMPRGASPQPPFAPPPPSQAPSPQPGAAAQPSAPAGVPRPGMVVPAPQGQNSAPGQAQPRR